MKNFFTHEVKIAITAIIAVVLLFFGLQFLKGLNVFSSNNIYYAQFKDISGLANGSPIMANGYKVGMVKDIQYNFSTNKDIIAVLSIDKQLEIPKGSYVELSTELLGGTSLNLIIGKYSDGLYEKGDTLKGGLANGVLNQVSEMVPNIEKILPHLDSILINLNHILSSPAIGGTIDNAEKLTAQLTNSAHELNGIMHNINTTLPNMMNKANNTLDEANDAMANVSSITKKIDEAGLDKLITELSASVAEAKTLLAKVNDSNGTMGALINDRQLYDNLNASVESLNKTLQQAELLFKDLKEHPKKYVHFSVF